MILEYVEGFSNNKCIEFFNLINGSIDFFDYIVNVYFNGFIIVGCIEDLFGILGVGEIYVICSNCVVNIFIQVFDKLFSNMVFNGNDVVMLEDDNGIVDVVG